jgi:RNA polymerase sigma-70 factor (ECF subfamily)
MSDEEVVRRIREGDGALFEILMRRYNQRLYRAVRAILPNDAEAEDVMQQAYINAYLHLDQFAGRAKFSTWLLRIAIHEALARARKSARLVTLDGLAEAGLDVSGPADRMANPEHQMFATELHALLESAVDALPPIYRVVFMLREIEGLSTAETAACLEIQQETVKTRLLRARARLRHHLSARFGAVRVSSFQFHAVRCDRVVDYVLSRLGLLRTTPQASLG